MALPSRPLPNRADPQVPANTESPVWPSCGLRGYLPCVFCPGFLGDHLEERHHAFRIVSMGVDLGPRRALVRPRAPGDRTSARLGPKPDLEHSRISGRAFRNDVPREFEQQHQATK